MRQYGRTVLGRDPGRTMLVLFTTWKMVRHYGRTNFKSRFFAVLFSIMELVRRYDRTVIIWFQEYNWCDNMVWDEILVAHCCFCLKRGIGATIWSHQFHISLFCCLSFKREIGVLFLFHKTNWCDNMVAQF